MVYIHVKQHVRTTVEGVELSVLASFEVDSDPAVIDLAMVDTAKFGVLTEKARYDRDVDTFFVNVKQSDRRHEYSVEAVASLIKLQVRETTKMLRSQRPPDHHANREAHADLG